MNSLSTASIKPAQASAYINAIVGLGNPGKIYTNTRHNIGFRILDAWAHQLGVSWGNQERFKAHVGCVYNHDHIVKLIKPMTFMNLSGESVGKIARFYGWKAANIAIIYDDITLECGRIKISMAGSAGGHNGVSSILSHLGNGFVRVRIGVGGKLYPTMDLAEHVLSAFSEQQEGFLSAQMQKIFKALKLLIDKGPIMTMNLVNQNGESNE